MSGGIEPTSACVLVFHPETGLVLAEKRFDGRAGLPGGRREESDRSSLACAARELHEETGACLHSASSILIYEAGPFICEAFLAVGVSDLPSPMEAATRGAWWVTADVLVDEKLGRFPNYCARMFARLAEMRARRFPTGRLQCV